MSTTYKQAGVDVEAGDALVDWLKRSEGKSKKSLQLKNVVDGIGGFAALYKASLFKKMKSPLLVSCTDGVGTKVLLASQFNRYESIGQDLVAMCVNDLICTGGDPLFFLDYYACAKLDLKSAKIFLAGVRRACDESDCILLGGETAEMPGVYHGQDFDCAGFAVGVVDAPKRLGSHKVRKGDRVIGVSSSGFHSNGYSLLRKVFSDDLSDWANELLKPTALYVQLAQKLRKKIKGLKALAHITGGGMENIPRVLPKGLGIELNAWSIPPAFLEVQKRAQLSKQELLSTLNCGIGLTVIVSPKDFSKAKFLIEATGFKAYDLGSIEKSAKPWGFK